MLKFIKRIKDSFVPHRGNQHEPHLLRHQSILFLFLLILSIQSFFLAQFFLFADRSQFLGLVLPDVLIEMTNKERAKNNSLPLTENILLQKAAQMKADDMASRNYFSHNTPEGLKPWYWLEQVGYTYKYAGENLAVNFFESENVARAWMNSQSHRANIIKPEYREIGVATASGIYKGKSTVFVVQFFGTQKSNTVLRTNGEPIKKNPVKEVIIVAQDKKPDVSVVVNSPVESKVLGEEVVVTVATAPFRSLAYIYTFFFLFILITILIVWFVRSELTHPKIMIRGLFLIGVIIFLLFLNIKLGVFNVTLPIESENSFIEAVS